MSDVKRYDACNLTTGEVVMAADYDAMQAAYQDRWERARDLQGEMDEVIRERDQLRAQAEALHQVGHALGLAAGSDLTREVLAGVNALRAELAAIRGQESALALELRKASSWICREVEAGTTSATHWAIRLRERADQIEAGTPQQPDAVSVPSDTALRRAAKFLAGIDNGCNEVKTLRALVANAQEDAVSDTVRLDFMLQQDRKVIVERVPGNKLEIYVEEGVMGDEQYPAIKHKGSCDGSSAEAAALKRKAIDMALLSTRQAEEDEPCDK